MSLTPATAETLRHTLATVVVVPVTPLSADGDPDWDTYAALTGRLIDGGIRVITPNGNTGEACGAQAFTSGLANVSPALALSMLDALRANDFGAAMKAWESVRRFEELRLADSSADNVSVVKEAMAQLGLCRADVRPPSLLLPPGIKQEITRILASWGLT